MPTTRQFMHLLHFIGVYICLASSSNCQQIPERTIICTQGGVGFIADEANIRTIDTDGTSVQKLIFPKDSRVTMYLEDTRALMETGEDFSVEEVRRLAKQTPYLAQEVQISHCEDEKKIRDSLASLHNQTTLDTVSLYMCNLNTEALAPLSAIKSVKQIIIRSCDWE
jgi:hypothetical protein